MAHKSEIDKLQQMMDSEAQTRSAADQVAKSNLEERETLIQHRKVIHT